MRRHGFGDDELRQLKSAYRVAFRDGQSQDVLLRLLELGFPEGPVTLLRQFLASSKRGWLRDRREAARPASLRVMGTPAEVRGVRHAA
jgi:hypothetical protein